MTSRGCELQVCLIALPGDFAARTPSPPSRGISRETPDCQFTSSPDFAASNSACKQHFPAFSFALWACSPLFRHLFSNPANGPKHRTSSTRAIAAVPGPGREAGGSREPPPICSGMCLQGARTAPHSPRSRTPDIGRGFASWEPVPIQAPRTAFLAHRIDGPGCS